MSNDKKLTAKQKLFCKAYLANGYNASQAALTAGYSKTAVGEIGHENLKKLQIKEYIAKRMDKIEEKLDITFEWKARMLKECADKCMQGEADKDGKVHPSGVIGAIAELNKMQGHYEPEKKEIYQKDISELINKHSKEY